MPYKSDSECVVVDELRGELRATFMSYVSCAQLYVGSKSFTLDYIKTEGWRSAKKINPNLNWVLACTNGLDGSNLDDRGTMTPSEFVHVWFPCVQVCPVCVAPSLVPSHSCISVQSCCVQESSGSFSTINAKSMLTCPRTSPTKVRITALIVRQTP